MTQIHWAHSKSANFNTPSDWKGGVVPGPNDAAILDAPGADFTVSVTTNVTVDTIQTAANATLEIDDGRLLIATDGTGPLAAAGANAGTITVASGGVEIGGVFNNTGSLDVNRSELNIVSNTTLYGGGVVNLAGGELANLGGGIATLTNVDNTISGFGVLSNNDVADNPTLVNEAKGVVDATGASAQLVITLDATIINAGLIEATGAAGLAIQFATVEGSAGGVILAGAGSIVTLGAADIIGGILRTAGDGVIATTNVGIALLDGTSFAVSNEGRIVINKGQTLGIEGAIVNSGGISVLGGGNPTLLRILPSGATLSGGGTIHLHGPSSEIAGLSSTAVLTNLDNHIVGAGQLGAGALSLVNFGVIEANQSTALVLDTGANTISNAGHIVADGSGGVTIESAMNNNGVLTASIGVLTVNGAVTGAGSGLVEGGTLDFASNFNQTVRFRQGAGTLELAQSQAYTAAITGFSTGGGTTLDLGDIGFVSAGEANFAGDDASGVLTVTDGTHTSEITLKGDYLGATFTASSDGHGGTDIVATTAALGPTVHRFVAAAASFGGAAGGSVNLAHDAWRSQLTLLAPRAAVA